MSNTINKFQINAAYCHNVRQDIVGDAHASDTEKSIVITAIGNNPAIANAGAVGALEFLISSDTIGLFALNSRNIYRIDLGFYVYNPTEEDQLTSLTFNQCTMRPSTASSDSAFYRHIISSTNIDYQSDVSIDGSTKNWVQIQLNDQAVSDFIDSIDSGWFAVGIKAGNDIPIAGSVEIGGMYILDRYDSLWESASDQEYDTEITRPPSLIIYTKDTNTEYINISMRYTSQDPTTAQNTPELSIGGYCSPNQVYTTDRINDSFGSNDTSLLVQNVSSVPSSESKLIQVGPEIMTYSNINNSESKLTGLSRGLSPSYSFPGRTQHVSEKISFLNINNLFNKGPAASPQYRCVAIVNDSDANGHISAFSPNNISASVIQNTINTAQIAIAVEVPKHDSHIGTVSSESYQYTLIDENNFYNFIDGHFNGSYLTYKGQMAKIISFTSSEYGPSTFTLDTSFIYTSGDNFYIHPAPSQRIAYESDVPDYDLSRISNFSNGPISIDFIDHDNYMWPRDIFYVWIRLTLSANQDEQSDSGATIALSYIDPTLEN